MTTRPLPVLAALTALSLAGAPSGALAQQAVDAARAQQGAGPVQTPGALQGPALPQAAPPPDAPLAAPRAAPQPVQPGAQSPVVQLTVQGPGAAAADSQVERVSLAEAVKRALAHNPTAEIAREELRRADALVEQARSGALPQLTGNLTYTRLDADRYAGTALAAGQNQLGANAQLAVPLLAPRAWATWSRAAEQRLVTQAGEVEVQRTVALSAARAYLSVLAQGRVLEATLRARDAARAHLDFAEQRLSGGVGTKLDALRAAQELATDEAQVEASITQLVRMREALGILMGSEHPADAGEAAPLPLPTSLQAALDDARTRREDVAAQEARRKAAEQSRSLDYLDYLPSITLSFQPFYQTPATTTLPTTGYQALAVLSIPFYDGGLRYGLQHERAALLAEAQTALEGLARQAQSDVRSSWDSVRHAEAALTAARESAKDASETLDLANLAYHAGTTTNLDVIDAERRARDAATSAAVAEDTALQARLDLLAASGHFPRL